MPDVRAAVWRFARPVMVTRPGATTYVDGRPVEAAGAMRTIRAVVLPVAGRQVLRVPEGTRVDAARTVISVEPLHAAEGDQAADVVAYGGEDWEVVSVEHHDQQGSYFRSIALRVGAR